SLILASVQMKRDFLITISCIPFFLMVSDGFVKNISPIFSYLVTRCLHD
ncbi:hypothetical protein HMPREF0519_1884, partial [Lentilactobacillus hilgardii DSM 20176 = ATCC 8290]